MDTQAIFDVLNAIQRIIAPHINQDGSLSPHAFRALLKLKGVKLKAFAETHGLKDPTVHQVINREFSNETIENLLAEALGLDADRIWGRK